MPALVDAPLGTVPDRSGDRRGWALAWICALAWGLIPALPAILAGDLVGSPWTDLYPAVWGLEHFARLQPAFPTFTLDLAAPEGMPFVYSSPLHGWAAWPLFALGAGPVAAWNATLVTARVATVACAYGAARAWGLGLAGALAAAMVWGGSPFFHGYAAEGIVEGTDGWTLALLAWSLAAAPRSARGSALTGMALGLVLMSSWYLGMVGCALMACVGARRAWSAQHHDRRDELLRAGASLLVGLVVASPFLWAFLTTMTGARPLSDEVRAAMGAPLALRTPGLLAPQPFALTTWVGVLLPVVAAMSARRHPRVALFALLCGVLSLGAGPWYDLPVLRSVRFPYRWHAGTLAALAFLAGSTVDGVSRAWLRRSLGPLLWLEGFLLSPIAPVLPGAPQSVPGEGVYAELQDAVVLEIPGPLAMPPGVVNRSRPRARYLLWGRTRHGGRSPWAPDFNGVAEGHEAPWLAAWRTWDPLARQTPAAPDLVATREGGVTIVLVHGEGLGEARARTLIDLLLAAGAEVEARDGAVVRLALPPTAGTTRP